MKLDSVKLQQQDDKGKKGRYHVSPGEKSYKHTTSSNNTMRAIVTQANDDGEYFFLSENGKIFSLKSDIDLKIGDKVLFDQSTKVLQKIDNSYKRIQLGNVSNKEIKELPKQYLKIGDSLKAKIHFIDNNYITKLVFDEAERAIIRNLQNGTQVLLSVVSNGKDDERDDDDKSNLLFDEIFEDDIDVKLKFSARVHKKLYNEQILKTTFGLISIDPNIELVGDKIVLELKKILSLKDYTSIDKNIEDEVKLFLYKVFNDSKNIADILNSERVFNSRILRSINDFLKYGNLYDDFNLDDRSGMIAKVFLENTILNEHYKKDCFKIIDIFENIKDAILKVNSFAIFNFMLPFYLYDKLIEYPAYCKRENEYLYRIIFNFSLEKLEKFQTQIFLNINPLKKNDINFMDIKIFHTFFLDEIQKKEVNYSFYKSLSNSGLTGTLEFFKVKTIEDPINSFRPI